MLNSFLDESINSLEQVKNDYQKSNDRKAYLAGIKNITGNVLNDDEIISITSFNKEEFIKKIKSAYETKKLERVKLIGIEENNDIEKKIFLQIIDFSWRSHLQYLEQLRQVIGLRSYGQKDPLLEFKKEAFNLFEILLEKIKTDVIKFLLNLNLVISNETERKSSSEKTDINETKKRKIQRNERCPCGSGKKYKHCCGSI